ncbi:hypothetical protein KZ804_05575 [Enterobacter cloacae]|uniref:hypothetical protein n=1 Tax=Enterobacter cloacae TaxID=550 RepID=UPI001A3242AE|nr:hypothetical protein [Enterobacter cloacae]MCC1991598.1 hypothetical protein [Enterobacter cloacae]MCC2009785.1 hypothetical protein [Enterobacter cloacae]MCC2019579.1 hypothetical protein [Enterobacter cloacae]HAT7684875.1 hypothetical protein [Enterobacter cloacae subsp. cloacae]
MSTESKPLSTGKAAVATTGWGAILSLVAGAIFTDPNNPWRTVVFALIPGLAAVITYFMNWFISRHGLESPEDAAKRSKCKRDLAEIEKHLKGNISTTLREKLLARKERTIEILVSIGSDNIISPLPEVKESAGQPD